ncbi:hypothetical protein R3P38DRAFT_3245858 [Favolaschia claudopus]|uniref:Uncharacterized protein n=1 Tax=Favolaschia claudopus TaxID=2862362 RepID=A0AAV9Z1P8_9AGAR
MVQERSSGKDQQPLSSRCCSSLRQWLYRCTPVPLYFFVIKNHWAVARMPMGVVGRVKAEERCWAGSKTPPTPSSLAQSPTLGPPPSTNPGPGASLASMARTSADGLNLGGWFALEPCEFSYLLLFDSRFGISVPLLFRIDPNTVSFQRWTRAPFPLLRPFIPLRPRSTLSLFLPRPRPSSPPFSLSLAPSPTQRTLLNALIPGSPPVIPPALLKALGD